jgi:hypothetical protein
MSPFDPRQDENPRGGYRVALESVRILNVFMVMCAIAGLLVGLAYGVFD